MNVQLPYFTRKQRGGIIALILLIVLLQLILFFVKNTDNGKEMVNYEIDEKVQLQIDRQKQALLKSYETQPFNPNFITDAKGFKLGMTTEEIDKLVAFRASGKYVNSAAEFQKVTGVSTEWLNKNAPYFKFPYWAQTQNRPLSQNQTNVSVTKIDLNKATAQQLIAIKGIGEYYANAVISERERLNGFVSTDQINFIKGLRPEAVNVLKQNTFVNKQVIQKVNVNNASKEELAEIPYITPYIARQIVLLRSKSDQPLKIEDLEKINNFPLDKLQIIRLYLNF